MSEEQMPGAGARRGDPHPGLPPQAGEGASGQAGEAALHARAVADAVVQRTADQLRSELEEMARRIDPFPPFPGAMFAYGIEVEPPYGGGGGDLGCVVLGNDGALYELQLGLDADQVALGGDHVAARHEELVPLALPPAEYIAYAHRAIVAAAEYVEERQ